MTSPEVHQLLDHLLAVLSRQGSSAATCRSLAPDSDSVRSMLVGAGYHDRDDVVDYFTWDGFGEPDRSGPLELFWETPYPINVQAAIELHRQATEELPELFSHELQTGQMTLQQLVARFPGPSHLLPIAVLDGSQWVAVDCRADPSGGSLWYVSVDQQGPFKLFETLCDALDAAAYCLESGLWWVAEEEDAVESKRYTQPDPLDLTSPPPWHGYDSNLG